jgi:hypothetical protein
LIIHLGDVHARCLECGHCEFVAVDPGTELDEMSELLCAGCETPVMQGELILQIAAEALKDARRKLRGENRFEALFPTTPD